MNEISEASKIAVITGASSGIGEAFAIELASQGYDLVIIARRIEKLDELANKVGTNFGTNSDIIIADLSQSKEIEMVIGRLKEIEGIEVLVNNAGYGLSGRFADVDLQTQLDMITVHNIASYSLTRAVVPDMIKRDKGTIINVSSMSGLMPRFGNVAYTVTKAFLIVFSEALQEELSNTKIKIQALCPGMTHTEFHDEDKLPHFDKSTVPKNFWMTSEDVAKKSLKALSRRKTIYVPGFRNRLLVGATNNFLIGGIIRFFVSWKLKRN
ncbi:MAG: SDR family oxidoreductase [Candidatus Heimdallarchaeota archaeon]|nr:SDR family oxidoreductase [Candidatus Heimdallarchaeota archaeon]